MANADVVAYNIAVLITTLFLLEFGADIFINHTAIVAQRTRIPETIIGLLTAGGEWEEVGPVPFQCKVVCQCLIRLLATACSCCCIPCSRSGVLGHWQHRRLGYLEHPGGILAGSPIS